MRISRYPCITLISARGAAFCFLLLIPQRTSAMESPDLTSVSGAYQPEIRPLIEQYCIDCHGSNDLLEGDVDLTAMTSWNEASRDPPMWQKVAEMLGNRLMPPDDAEQPSEAERERLQSWVADYLTLEAKARAGDPGRVILRRLNNAEYTYTLRDLTGVPSLDPAREFPADGAAGEGFRNTGGALAMSPALVAKYLDAAKEVASHALLLPSGFRFSRYATRRDWTDEALAEIRAFYGRFTDAGGGDQVNLQGIVFETNAGGRLPIEKYLAATLAEREALETGRKSSEGIARERGLSAKYLEALWAHLTGTSPSLLLDELRKKWRSAQPTDAAALAADVEQWQKSLWVFGSVGQIGRKGGPQRWMEPVDPMTTQQEIRYKIPEAAADEEVTISLVVSDAGDGNDGDVALWRAPRLVSPGQPDLLLRDVREVVRRIQLQRDRMFADTAKYLNAAHEIASSIEQLDVDAIAQEYGVEQPGLEAWLAYLGIGFGAAAELQGHYAHPLTRVGGYDFVNGWGSADTPSLVANASDEHVRIPGNMPPHSIAVHPSPTLRSGVAWRSPIAARVRIEGSVTHAHPECGNGVTWLLELRRGSARKRLAAGTAQGGGAVPFGPLGGVVVRLGDVIALTVGSREGNHGCDLTTIDVTIAADKDDDQATWNLVRDASDNVLEANPHPDRFGNADVWRFFSEPDVDSARSQVIPADSLLAKWQSATSSEERLALANALQGLLQSGLPVTSDGPDAQLYRQLASLRGPLAGGLGDRTSESGTNATPSGNGDEIGLDPAVFGRRPNGDSIDPVDLCVRAPSVLEIRLPADLAAGCELATTGELDKETGSEGTVQFAVVEGKPSVPTTLLRGETEAVGIQGPWSINNIDVSYTAPIVVSEGSAAQQRTRAAIKQFRDLFPAALCYTKIVPVDEVVTLTLFYREDDHLVRLLLDESQAAQLDQLWDELHFVSRDALALVDAYGQLMEFATQDADPAVFEHMREPIYARAAAFKRLLVESESRQIEALIDFAARAYRRPLAVKEADDLRLLYEKLRAEEMGHEQAFRLTLVRVLTAPAFLYRIEKPYVGKGQGPVSDWELASRLSYFLWGSQPDAELRQAAAEGSLQKADVLAAQARRMLRDVKTRRLAIEFACQWLHIDDFEHFDEKSERHFPTFAELRGAMAEESIRFFADLFQNGGSVLEILDADYAFLNEDLARHYGIPGVTGAEWRRVEGVKQFSRGGVLAQATILATQSGASRTSPILRGNWISEVLLGERTPKPPKGVPPLPDDEAATDGLTVRQLVEKHVRDPKCAVCHRRIDPYGFALEAFDAVGALRQTDLGMRPIDTRARSIDGAEFDGLDGLRNYLKTTRRGAFLRQFCKKMLGYALGREVQLSDEPLLTDMQTELSNHDFRVDVAVEMIVLSRQFREIRAKETAFDD